MKKAVIYARFSSNRQTEQSIEGQIRECKKYAKQNDIKIVKQYIDRAATGTNDKRQNFQQMLKDSKKQAWDYVLVYKIDRFSRNKYEIAKYKKTLKDNNIKLLSVTENIPDTPEGIILESILEGMAEYYSAELSQKVKRGHKESRLKGKHHGGPLLFGYKKKDNKVYINEKEAPIIQYMYEQYAQGKNCRELAEELENKGIFYRGKPFTQSTIINLLKNKCYIGIFVHKNEIYNNIFPAIIQKNLYEMVRKKAEENRFGKISKPKKYILLHKVFCGYCGCKMGTTNGSHHRYYYCSKNTKTKKTNKRNLEKLEPKTKSTKKRKTGRTDIRRKNFVPLKTEKCLKKYLQRDILEETIINTTSKIFNSNILNFLIDSIVKIHNSKIITNSPTISLQKEKQDTQNKIENLLKLIEQGIITSDTKQQLQKLENKLTDLNIQIILKENNKPVNKTEIINFIENTLSSTPEIIIDNLIKKIILYDDKVEIYYKYTNEIVFLENILENPIYTNEVKFSISKTNTIVLKIEAFI